jgi:monoamine oxidase
VISAMPQALLGHLTFEPPLPPLKLQLIQRIPMGSIIKTIMFYETAFWKGKGIRLFGYQLSNVKM